MAPIVAFMRNKKTDLWLLNGPLTEVAYRDLVSAFSVRPFAQKGSNKKAALVAATYGGYPGPAYKISKLFSTLYPEGVELWVGGPCKSAGTLLAIGADSIVLGLFGELGPLDVQLLKPNERRWSSGLDTVETFDSVGRHLTEIFFETYALLVESGEMSLGLAADIACRLTTGYVQPIAQQIDPYRLAEVERLLRIARSYGEMLDRGNLKPGSLERLINDYPAHDFIIDRAEAAKLFHRVRGLSPDELAAMHCLGALILTPEPEPTIMDLRQLLGEAEDTDAKNKTGLSEMPGDTSAEPGDVGATAKKSSGKPSRSRAGRSKANQGAP